MKLIDAKENLSIQVHPKDSHLEFSGSNGKEECWYILEASLDAEILIGHNALTKEDFVKSVNQNHFEKLFKKYPISKGDFFYIPAGTVHAILKNTIVLEVSQSSDLTYRLYDYNRRDINGNLRTLHIKEALKVVNIPDNKIIKKHRKKYFDFQILQNKNITRYNSDKFGDYLVLIEGEGYIDNSKFNFGDFYMVSSNTKYELKGNFKFAKVTLF